MTIHPALVAAAFFFVVGVIGYQWYRIGTLKARVAELEAND